MWSIFSIAVLDVGWQTDQATILALVHTNLNNESPHDPTSPTCVKDPFLGIVTIVHQFCLQEGG